MFTKKLLKTATICCSENFLTKRLRKSSEYTLVIMRFILESCLEIGISAMICVLMIDERTFQDVWESVSTIFAFITLAALVIAPAIFLKYT